MEDGHTSVMSNTVAVSLRKYRRGAAQKVATFQVRKYGDNSLASHPLRHDYFQVE